VPPATKTCHFRLARSLKKPAAVQHRTRSLLVANCGRDLAALASASLSAINSTRGAKCPSIFVIYHQPYRYYFIEAADAL
jgi:hypothetical protein